MHFSLGDKFSGPLDLLLRLVEDKELLLSDISLSSVTEQFLAYIAQMDERDPVAIADFLVVGTRLVLLKSRLLLPHLGVTEEDEDGSSLAAQLRMYKAFVSAGKHLAAMWSVSPSIGFHAEPPKRSFPPVMPSGVSPASLHRQITVLVRRLAPPKPLPETRIDGRVTLQEKIQHIQTIFSRMKSASFHDMLSDKDNKTEVIVLLLALLELMKARTVLVEQESAFGHMIISKNVSV